MAADWGHRNVAYCLGVVCSIQMVTGAWRHFEGTAERVL